MRKIFLMLSIITIISALILTFPTKSVFAEGVTLSNGQSQIHSTSIQKSSGVSPLCVVGPNGQCFAECSIDPNPQNCTGVDPIAGGCGNDAVTLISATIGTQGYLQLRWSQACQSNWTRVVTNGQTATLSAWTNVYSNDNVGQYYTSTGTSIWTNMVYAGNDPAWIQGQINNSTTIYDQKTNTISRSN